MFRGSLGVCLGVLQVVSCQTSLSFHSSGWLRVVQLLVLQLCVEQFWVDQLYAVSLLVLTTWLHCLQLCLPSQLMVLLLFLDLLSHAKLFWVTNPLVKFSQVKLFLPKLDHWI